MHKKYYFGLFLAFLLTVQLACNAVAPAGQPDTVATLNGLYTAAAQTSTAAVQAGGTATPGLPLPTASPLVSPPTSTPFFLPTTSGPVARCDAAGFVKDVTIADGTVLGRGAGFTKTWRLQNTGTCTWTSSYALVFVSGDSMGGPSAVGLGGTVYPGETIDLSAYMIAPSANGHYRGYWKLRNASNATFGIGADATTAFWVDVVVKGTSHAAYDFVEQYCQAEWENNNSALACPGSEGDDNGYVVRLEAPKLENGVKSDDPGLLTFPKSSNRGFISGTYPAFEVQSGDRFQALVNCRYGADRCNVIFKLEFRSAGQVRTLGTWNEAYEGRYYPIDMDLSFLAGQTGKFILTVEANGSARDDEAVWIAPRIVRNGPAPATNTPAPSATPTATATATATATSTATATATATLGAP